MEKKKTEKEKKKFQPVYTPVKTTQLPNAPNPLNRSLHDHPPSPPRRMSSRTQRWLNRAPPPSTLSKRREGIEPRLASPRLGSPRLGSARAKLGHSLKRCRTRACTLRGVVVVVVGRGRRREIGGKKISDFHYGRARGGGCISRGADDFTGGRVRIFLPFGSRAECISGTRAHYHQQQQFLCNFSNGIDSVYNGIPRATIRINVRSRSSAPAARIDDRSEGGSSRGKARFLLSLRGQIIITRLSRTLLASNRIYYFF